MNLSMANQNFFIFFQFKTTASTKMNTFLREIVLQYLKFELSYMVDRQAHFMRVESSYLYKN